MTLVIGMYYNNKEGALIASDSILVKENDCYRQVKNIFEIRGVLLTMRGSWGLDYELIELTRRNLNGLEELDSWGIRKGIQKGKKELLDYYKGEGPILSEDDNIVEGIFGFYINKPEIFELTDEGIIEPIENFAVGGGDGVTDKILGDSYKKEISKKNAIELAVYSMVETSKIKKNSDEYPQIALIEKNGNKILNYDKNEDFDVYHPEISQIKKKMEILSKQQKIAFDILLCGKKEEKSKLIKILDEHKGK